MLNNNVDVDFWRPVEGAPNRVPDPRSWRLLYVGGIDHTKGVFVMIEAMRVLAKREAQWNLTIIGSWGEYDRSEAMRMITEYDLGDSIEFLPASNRETIREHHRQADLFLYQTVNDAFPRVVLEAIASGLPVVASHHPGIDVVDPMGEFISFTEFGDVSQIVSHVEKMRSDPAEWSRKSTIGAQRVVEGFSTEVIAKAYCDYYDSISKSRETAQNGAANQR